MSKMNVSTERKFVSVLIKTKLLAILSVMAFLFSGVPHAKVQDDNLAASIDNLDDLTGCSVEQVKAAAISDEIFPEDDKSKIFFTTSRRDYCSMPEVIGVRTCP